MTSLAAADCVSIRKTQAMWLGSGQQLDKIDIREVSVVSIRVSV